MKKLDLAMEFQRIDKIINNLADGIERPASLEFGGPVAAHGAHLATHNGRWP